MVPSPTVPTTWTGAHHTLVGGELSEARSSEFCFSWTGAGHAGQEEEQQEQSVTGLHVIIIIITIIIMRVNAMNKLIFRVYQIHQLIFKYIYNIPG